MNICEIGICYFVVWSPEQLYIEEIHRDNHFFQRHIDKIDCFITNVVLPEVIGCWFTRNESAPDVQSTRVPLEEVTNGNSRNPPKPDVDVFCVCKKPDDGSKMILCENENCRSGKWFHLKCLNIKRVPKGDWFCLDCKEL